MIRSGFKLVFTLSFGGDPRIVPYAGRCPNPDFIRPATDWFVGWLGFQAKITTTVCPNPAK